MSSTAGCRRWAAWCSLLPWSQQAGSRKNLAVRMLPQMSLLPVNTSGATSCSSSCTLIHLLVLGFWIAHPVQELVQDRGISMGRGFRQFLLLNQANQLTVGEGRTCENLLAEWGHMPELWLTCWPFGFLRPRSAASSTSWGGGGPRLIDLKTLRVVGLYPD